MDLNYTKVARSFEIDLNYTLDGGLVCLYDGNGKVERCSFYDKKFFKTAKIAGHLNRLYSL